jgi:hypothetical protein
MDAEQSARVNHHAARCCSSTDSGVSITAQLMLAKDEVQNPASTSRPQLALTSGKSRRMPADYDSRRSSTRL